MAPPSAINTDYTNPDYRQSSTIQRASVTSLLSVPSPYHENPYLLSSPPPQARSHALPSPSLATVAWWKPKSHHPAIQLPPLSPKSPSQKDPEAEVRRDGVLEQLDMDLEARAAFERRRQRRCMITGQVLGLLFVAAFLGGLVVHSVAGRGREGKGGVGN